MIDFVLNADVHLGRIIDEYGALTYGILFAIIFAETGLVLTPFLPGDSLLFAAGLFAANGSMNVIILALMLWTAAFLGDNTNYWIGYYFGQKMVDNKYVPINQKYIDKTNDFYAKHGGKTIFLARFMPIIRTFAPFVAGIGKMNYKNFIFYSFIGGFSWIFVFIFAGYFFGNIPIIKNNFSTVILAIIATSFFPAAFKIVRSKLQKTK
ncbi:MAG TPA: DedA family protein [Candidatus Moranbacteria bacterium]|nr:DedA family protein [Candidatus Moranbacteria bacterium]